MFFLQILKGNRSVLAFVGTILLVVIGYILGQLPISIVAGYYAMQNGHGMETLTRLQDTMDFSLVGMDQNLTLVLILFTFIGALIGLWVGMRYFHKRRFQTLINGGNKIRWERIFFAFYVWMGMTLLSEVLFYYQHPEDYTFQLDPGAFILLLLIVVLLLPIQTSTEEFFTRGYLMQLFGYMSRYPWVAAIGTSLIFALLHGMNPEVEKFGKVTMMSYYFSVGLFLAVLTILDDGLELALGIHAATNMYGATFVTYSGSAIKTPALFSLDHPNIDGMVFQFMVAAGIFLFFAWKRFGPWSWFKLFHRLDFEGMDRV